MGRPRSSSSLRYPLRLRKLFDFPFKEGYKGVNQPSQLRYITLFSYMMSNQLVFNPIVITRITIEGVELSNGRVTIKSGFDNGSEVDYRSYENKKHLVYNDVVIYVYQSEVGFFGYEKGEKITAWICFHTSLLHTMKMNIKTGDNKGKLIFLVKDIDPYSLAKSERYQKMNNKWKKKNVINGEAKCVFGNALNDIKKTICGQ